MIERQVIEINTLVDDKPDNGDACMVMTWGYWRELTWYKAGIGPHGEGFYNNADIKQSNQHLIWFLSPTLSEES